SSGGGIRSSEDADSEGQEGRFYTWTVRQMESVLSLDEVKAVLIAAGTMTVDDSLDALTDAERDAERVLRLATRPSEFERVSVGDSEAGLLFRSALRKLSAARMQRVRPGMDDKVVTDWNGLAIAALARAGRALGEQGFVDSAVRCADFVLTGMRDEAGRLVHTYRGGGTPVPAFLDDYAFMADGLLELYQATHEPRYLREAVALTTRMIDAFWDGENGAFFQTADEAERMVVRVKPAFDGAMPSGNSVAASVLLRIGRLTDDATVIDHADRLFSALAPMIESSPGAFPHLLSAYMMRYSESYVSIVVGDTSVQGTRELIRTINETYTPVNTLVVVPVDRPARHVVSLVPAARDAVLVDGHEAAYVCSGNMCSQPVDTPQELRGLLKGRSPAG
ncbi:MAG: thioredoxin domain-containing protein, partial [Chloroflexota bacterium]